MIASPPTTPWKCIILHISDRRGVQPLNYLDTRAKVWFLCHRHHCIGLDAMSMFYHRHGFTRLRGFFVYPISPDGRQYQTWKLWVIALVIGDGKHQALLILNPYVYRVLRYQMYDMTGFLFFWLHYIGKLNIIIKWNHVNYDVVN